MMDPTRGTVGAGSIPAGIAKRLLQSPICGRRFFVPKKKASAMYQHPEA